MKYQLSHKFYGFTLQYMPAAAVHSAQDTPLQIFFEIAQW